MVDNFVLLTVYQRRSQHIVALMLGMWNVNIHFTLITIKVYALNVSLVRYASRSSSSFRPKFWSTNKCKEADRQLIDEYRTS